MAQSTDTMDMLDLMIRPGFCVKDQTIVKANAAALAIPIEVGTPVRKLLASGEAEYAAFSGGCLYLTLDLYGTPCGASVTRMADCDVFLLDLDAGQSELQAMALAARELRDPLTSIMTTADCLFPTEVMQKDPYIREQLSRMNRGMYQLLRIIGNMSDAERYASGSSARKETQDITGLMAEIFGKAAVLAEHTGITLEFTNLRRTVTCLADKDMLERAILNLLSNSLKFTPKGGTISASLTQRKGLLILTIQDNGEGINEHAKGSLYSHFLRRTAIEDSRQGIGLGMVLVRSAASQHGGTVLLDQPEEGGTRITMTIAIRQNTDSIVRSHQLRIDYAGERDHNLIELAEILPAALYETK